MKNRSRFDLHRWLGPALAATLDAVPPATPSPVWLVDAVTWVPASREGGRRRGVDQGRLLARSVGAALGVPAVCLLARTDRSGGRSGRRSRHQRLDGPSLGVVAGAAAIPAGVLIVDDVVTTGGSMRAAVRALRESGAHPVHGAALAVADAPR
ncbi:MAG: phosphoribosyltransferase family protein [Actinomycetota bacterium]